MLKFISLLGTSPYLPCNYYIGENTVNDCCYIQKALIEILVNQDIEIDKVTIFTTDHSFNKNWIVNAYDHTRLGLRDELESLSKKKGFQVENIGIPEGHNEEELWEIFKTILDQLEEGDEIILDITHSFRYLPMLTFIIINYARIVKKCSLKAVYYGAFEVLGYGSLVAKLPIEERNAPIFDLTPFIDLFDWTLAIDRYLATGDASLVENLTSSEVKKINEEIRRQASSSTSKFEPAVLFKDPNALKNLSNSMKKFSEMVSTCRGTELTNTISSLKKSISTVVENTAYERVKPLSPIMEMLKDRFDNFSYEDEDINMIETAKWCYDNKMYQQGLTILEEGLINYICKKWSLDSLDINNRKKVTSHAFDVSRNNIKADNVALGMSKENANDLFILLYNIGDMRNDINHAGWRDKPSKPSAFESSLKKFINKAKSLILSIEEESKEKRLLLIFSHQLTEKQERDAVERFNISKFIELDEELLIKWANVPPNLEDLKDYLEDIIKWIDHNGRPGDYALVQGDFGATGLIVDYCLAKGIIPIYATTERKAVEENYGDQIKISRVFEHVMFRKYQTY
ncbi:MAG: TIGR02221 family CRISPR-associated protein [Tissierellia bacterium]|nr:TIGR02221 family CRISPR-associated protein [Tissierellia bacterium]